MSIPFYGGINGQSFKITAKFNNRVELVADVNKGWNSSVCMVGEYVVIDYGEPSAETSSDYQRNKATDLSVGYFNATVWQKVYTDATTSTDELIVGTNGIGYKRLFFVAVPPFAVTTNNPGVITLDPGTWNEDTEEYDMTNPRVDSTSEGDVYNFQFSLPKAWDIQLDPNHQVVEDEDIKNGLIRVNPDSAPEVDLRDTSDTKYLTFTLPYAQDFQDKGTIVFDRGLGIDGQGRVVLNGSLEVDKETAGDGATSRNPILRLHLPVYQFLQSSAVRVNKIDPSALPTAAVTYEDTNHQYPIITVGFPRAEEYNFGIYLQEEEDQTIEAEIEDEESGEMIPNPEFEALSDLKVGDYYVNTTLAAVHKIVSSSNEEIQTEYKGSFWKDPDVISTGIDPYDANGNVVDPTVEVEQATSPDQPWKLTFGIPKAPVYQPSQDSGFVASTAEGEISAAASNDTITWTLKIPKGTRFYAGVALNNITDMEDGDLYLDSTGDVLKYDVETETWIRAENIKGAPGDDLEVINASPIDIDADTASINPFSYGECGRYIETNFPQYANPASNQVVNITYTPSGESNNFLSYWLFKVGGTWTGAKLTGDASNSMIIDAYSSLDETAKTYSVNYINHNVGYETVVEKRSKTLVERINDLETALALLEAKVDNDIKEQKSWGAISDLDDEE